MQVKSVNKPDENGQISLKQSFSEQESSFQNRKAYRAAMGFCPKGLWNQKASFWKQKASRAKKRLFPEGFQIQKAILSGSRNMKIQAGHGGFKCIWVGPIAGRLELQPIMHLITSKFQNSFSIHSSNPLFFKKFLLSLMTTPFFLITDYPHYHRPSLPVIPLLSFSHSFLFPLSFLPSPIISFPTTITTSTHTRFLQFLPPHL